MTKSALQSGNFLSNKILWMLSVMAGVSVANIYYMQPLMDMVRNDLNIDVFDVNIIVMLTQVGYAVGLFFIIPLGDMLNRKRLIMANFAILIISLLATGYSFCYELIALASFFTGLCSVSPQIFIPMAAQYSSPEKKARNIGMVLSGLLSGILLSRVISGLIGDCLGWPQMFLIASVMMLACLICVERMLPDIPSSYHCKYKELIFSLFKFVHDYPALRLYSVRSAFAFGSFLALWANMAFKLKGAPFYADSDAVGLLGLCGIAGVMTASSAGKYIKKIGVRNFHFIGCAFQLLAWLILYWKDSSYIGLIVGIVLIDIGMQCIQLSNQSSIFALCPFASNRVNTIYMTTYFIGGSAGTFLSGISWQYMGWNGVVITGTFLTLCSIVISLFSDR